MTRMWQRETVQRKLFYLNFHHGYEHSEEREAELNALLEDGWQIKHEVFSAGHLYLRLERIEIEMTDLEEDDDTAGYP